ncbi:hypothetical protein ACFVGN_42445, partial [Streptomyces sp. NPDC057757]|uniref:hypothetical protein n=1 Tax=Streptomyces sp. NPDC057757 TaxID=3346241 RepID=UPI0036C564C5
MSASTTRRSKAFTAFTAVASFTAVLAATATATTPANASATATTPAPATATTESNPLARLHL